METHLITGCAGFISKHLIQKLIKEKIKIIGIDNFLLGNKENIDFIKNNWDKYLVLRFRGQHLSDDDLVRFSKYFGELDPPGPNPY